MTNQNHRVPVLRVLPVLPVFARLALFAPLAFLASCATLDTQPVFSPPGTTTVIIMVRHAEREPGLDPPLNAEGLVRAQALADELEDEGVTAAFYPSFIRNRQTADPLAERVELIRREYTSLEATDTKALANKFVDEVVRDHAGGVVLWIGNTGPEIEGVQSGNLQEIYVRLGGAAVPPIRYQDIYRITLHEDTPPTIDTAVYGGPSSLD